MRLCSWLQLGIKTTSDRFSHLPSFSFTPFPWLKSTWCVPCLDLQVFRELKQLIQQYEARMNQYEEVWTRLKGVWFSLDLQFSQNLRNPHSPSSNTQYIAHSAAETVAAAYTTDMRPFKKLWGPGINAIFYDCHSMTKMCTNSGFWENKNKCFSGYKGVARVSMNIQTYKQPKKVRALDNPTAGWSRY